ncbi:MAG TPA: hypothetical protein VKH81_14770 [Candidatus Angelobacter sp.]|nr:hypothetical protein [Candidatus Angelobacter sp.]
MRVALEFVPAQSTEQRCRLRYAFQLFCAIYGHKPILENTRSAIADVLITYSSDPGRRPGTKVVRLYNGYRPRPLTSPAPRPCSFGQEDKATVLFYPPEDSAEPDWLGEIFEWTSCAHEYSARGRDSVGRIPFEESIFARYRLDEQTPYAGLAMWFLQRAICRLSPVARESARAPETWLGHAIVCSHDVDFISSGYFSTLYRLAKNALISLLQKSPIVALGIAARAVRFALGGKNPLRNIEKLARWEHSSGLTSSFNFIARHGHRRDANYRIEDPAVIALAQRLQSMGMEIGLHGSYTSLNTNSGLAEEFGVLQQQGFRALGSRQHWLRFTLDRLIPAVENAGAHFDTSFGWQNRIGFRAGACFPFPPYNFAEERPARFLELPLAVMDQALPAKADDAFAAVKKLLATSRMYGWGGVSLLWHPEAFGGGQLPVGIGRAFYELVRARAAWKDTWVSGEEFVRRVRHRFVEAGLMDTGWGRDFINVDESAQVPVEAAYRRSFHAALS